MTFFNKKTEVMQIEMTPYGRYLYSIGKFKPHSYEFVDDDVLYRMPDSGETQESAHSRIINETPKTKINRAFQDEAEVLQSPATISDLRTMTRKMNQRQANIFPLGRSAYSGTNIPTMQTTMLQGAITGSTMTHTFNGLNEFNVSSTGGEVLIPQVDIDIKFTAFLRDSLDPTDSYDGSSVRSSTFSDGTYIEIRYIEPIIHLKEFNSFYEKENFDIEVFNVTDSGQTLTTGDEILTPLKMHRKASAIVNDFLVDRIIPDEILEDASFDNLELQKQFVQYYFDIQADGEIPPEELCKVVDKLEVNSRFLNEELICPDLDDERIERFDIYGTRVGPEDLEDCD